MMDFTMEKKMKYEEEFIAWLHSNYQIGNGHTLVRYMEDGVSYDAFLEEMGLTDE
jgi:hypothetical protein